MMEIVLSRVSCKRRGERKIWSNLWEHTKSYETRESLWLLQMKKREDEWNLVHVALVYFDKQKSLQNSCNGRQRHSDPSAEPQFWKIAPKKQVLASNEFGKYGELYPSKQTHKVYLFALKGSEKSCCKQTRLKCENRTTSDLEHSLPLSHKTGINICLNVLG